MATEPRPRSRLPPALDGRAWEGVIRRYREFLPVGDATPVVTLHEGSTPLLPAPRLSERVGAEVYLKIEGANPTGSFKDRGMTMAISKAARGGRSRPSSAPRPATPRPRPRPTRPGRGCAASCSSPRATSRSASSPRRSCTGRRCSRSAATSTSRSRSSASCRARAPVVVVNSVNPLPHRGPEDRRLRDRRRARRRARRPLHPGRQRREHHRLLAGLPRVPRRRALDAAAADVRLPGRRRRADRRRPPDRAPRDGRHGDPDRQPGLLVRSDGRGVRVGRRDRRR